MKSKFYSVFDGVGYSHRRVRLDILGVPVTKLEIESSLSTTSELWQRPRPFDCFEPLLDERGWYWRLAERIGEVLKGE